MGIYNNNLFDKDLNEIFDNFDNKKSLKIHIKIEINIMTIMFHYSL